MDDETVSCDEIGRTHEWIAGSDDLFAEWFPDREIRSCTHCGCVEIGGPPGGTSKRPRWGLGGVQHWLQTRKHWYPCVWLGNLLSDARYWCWRLTRG